MLARLDATDLALLQAAQDRAEQDWREALSVQSATHEAAVDSRVVTLVEAMSHELPLGKGAKGVGRDAALALPLIAKIAASLEPDMINTGWCQVVWRCRVFVHWVAVRKCLC